MHRLRFRDLSLPQSLNTPRDRRQGFRSSGKNILTAGMAPGMSSRSPSCKRGGHISSGLFQHQGRTPRIQRLWICKGGNFLLCPVAGRGHRLWTWMFFRPETLETARGQRWPAVGAGITSTQPPLPTFPRYGGQAVQMLPQSGFHPERGD